MKLKTLLFILFFSNFYLPSAHAVNSADLTNAQIIELFHKHQDQSQLINLQLNGGTHAIGQILEQSGGSRSIGDMTVFYSMTSTAERLRSIIPQFDERSELKEESGVLRKFSFSTEEAACAHAEDGYRRGLKYQSEESRRRKKEITRVLGIGSASALAYFSPSDLKGALFKKGEHRAHLCTVENDQAHTFSMVFPPDFVEHFMQTQITEETDRLVASPRCSCFPFGICRRRPELTPEQTEQIKVFAAAELRKFEEAAVTRFLLAQLARKTVPDFRYNDTQLNTAGFLQVQISEQTKPVTSFGFTAREAVAGLPELAGVTPNPIGQLISGEVSSLLIEDGTSILHPLLSPSTVLFPGSFNPIHSGHIEMARAASQILNDQMGSLGNSKIIFELSIANVDKPRLEPEEIESRIAQIQKAGFSVLLTRAPRFFDKVALFPSGVRPTFLAGMDTVERLLDPKYTDGKPDQMIAQLTDFQTRGLRFLVAAREDRSGTLVQLPDLERYRQLPPHLKSLFEEIPHFQNPASSTVIRNRSTPAE